MTAQPIVELSQRLQAALGDAYVVERALGTGGFAVVFLVRDLRLKRPLAVKVLSPDIVTSSTMIDRFRREAEVIAQLSHPNIVPLHFIGDETDLAYLAMGFIDGGSLADRLMREPQLPIHDATQILVEVAGALAHAHKRGIVHRDIKPQNVLLDADSGRALVTDFGIARTMDSRSLTATGIVLGTPAYLAPEQLTGETSDHRVDIYALGVMGYEIIAGRPPFSAPTPAGVLMKRLAGPPDDIRQIRSDVPNDLLAVIDTCLATEPAERFQSAVEVVRALTGVTPTSGGQRRPGPRMVTPVRRRAVWLGAGAVAIVAGVLATTPLRRAIARLFDGSAGAVSADVPQGMMPAVDSGMVLLAAGDYPIGTDAGPPNAAFRPGHRVTLTAFALDRREVTVGEYRRYVDSVGVVAPWPANALPASDLPVTSVTFSDAAAYCRFRHPEGGRLPSEEEWEAAARGKTGRRFPWGDDAIAGRANVGSSRRQGPAPVGAFSSGATPEGIVDLIGNVWEWTSSPMRAYPGGPSLADSLAQYRVIRGGAFNTLDTIATPWWRAYGPASGALPATGFRCAMSGRKAPDVATKR